MNEKQFYYMIMAMERYGGSFVVALADCFRKADAVNFAKLMHAFPEYMKEYSQKGEMLSRKQEKPDEITLSPWES